MLYCHLVYNCDAKIARDVALEKGTPLKHGDF